MAFLPEITLVQAHVQALFSINVPRLLGMRYAGDAESLTGEPHRLDEPTSTPSADAGPLDNAATSNSNVIWNSGLQAVDPSWVWQGHSDGDLVNPAVPEYSPDIVGDMSRVGVRAFSVDETAALANELQAPSDIVPFDMAEPLVSYEPMPVLYTPEELNLFASLAQQGPMDTASALVDAMMTDEPNPFLVGEQAIGADPVEAASASAVLAPWMFGFDSTAPMPGFINAAADSYSNFSIHQPDENGISPWTCGFTWNWG